MPVARTSVAQEGSSSVTRFAKNSPQFIAGSAKNAVGIARRFSNSKSEAHHHGRTPTFRRKLYIGREIRCATYIILSLGFQASEYCFTHVRPSRDMFPWNRSRMPQQNQLTFSCTSTYLLF